MPKIIVTEDQWLQLGTERFSNGGVEALVIENMAGALKCSKSSFYWYFANRPTFIRRLVDRWVEQSTEQVIRASLQHAAAEDKMNQLLYEMFAVTQKGDFLFYLRKLSEQESVYEEVLDQIEQVRLNLAKELFMELGFSDEMADSKAWILYHYYLGWYERHKQHQLQNDDVLSHIARLRKHLVSI